MFYAVEKQQRNEINYCTPMGPAPFGETKQAAKWALIGESCSAALRTPGRARRPGYSDIDRTSMTRRVHRVE